MTTPTIRCSNCGNESLGRFCSNCGRALPQTIDTQDPEASAQSFLSAVSEAEQGARELDNIERQFILELQKIRRAIESEMRWGGVIFNSKDIAKASQRAFNQIGDLNSRVPPLMYRMANAADLGVQLEELGISNDRVKQATTRLRAFGSRAIQFQQTVEALIDWMNNFTVSLAHANSPRPLRIMTPPLDWEG